MLLLAALVVIEANVDLRFVFANLTQPIGKTLTFGQEMAPGLLILLAISAGDWRGGRAAADDSGKLAGA